jgi:hypothetical protein
MPADDETLVICNLFLIHRFLGLLSIFWVLEAHIAVVFQIIVVVLGNHYRLELSEFFKVTSKLLVICSLGKLLHEQVVELGALISPLFFLFMS